MSITHLNNENLAIETTRKKSIQIMQKGIVSYKLACLGWEISDHYGDGYDLLCVYSKTEKPHIIKLELKGVDINYSGTSPGFSQSVSQNEISTASHLVISLFDDISPIGHYIMTLSQMFESKKSNSRNNKDFSDYLNFEEYRRKAIISTKKKIITRKGHAKKEEKQPRLDIDIGCTPKQFNKRKWFLEEFNNKWENLLQVNQY